VGRDGGFKLSGPAGAFVNENLPVFTFSEVTIVMESTTEIELAITYVAYSFFNLHKFIFTFMAKGL